MLLVLLAGAITPLAFAPFKWYPLVLLTMGVLLLLSHTLTPKQGFWSGFLFGVGMFGIGVSWVFVSLHRFGNMSGPLAVFAVSIFVVILSMFPALTMWAYIRSDMQRFTPGRLLVFPALWVVFEWVRSWLFTGFPWLIMGYSQVPGVLSAAAPYIGVFGVSLLLVLSAALLVEWWAYGRNRWMLVSLVSVWVLVWLAGQIDWVQPQGQPIKIVAIQGNIGLDRKWDTRQSNNIVQQYLRQSAKHGDADLIIWPEAAIPAYRDAIESTWLNQLRVQARETQTDFIIGIIEREKINGRQTYYNSAISLGQSESLYRKRHLVPFGEFLPLKWLLGWLVNYLHIPMSDFSSGPDTAPLVKAAGQTIGISICYEDAFGEEVIDALPEAGLLVNISEDAWFGDSLAPHQRLQIASMRALESGRAMVRAANTGPSAHIDHRGKVLVKTGQFEAGSLQAEVQPMQGATPYVRWGNAAFLLITGIMLATAFGLRRRQQTATANQD